MTAAAILDALQLQGVTLLEREGSLFARPLEPLTAPQRELIEANKAGLLALVQARPAFIKTLLVECQGRILSNELL